MASSLNPNAPEFSPGKSSKNPHSLHTPPEFSQNPHSLYPSPELSPAHFSQNPHFLYPPPELSPSQFSQNPHSHYPPPEFSPAHFSQNPHFLYPPPELSPAQFQPNPNFLYPQPELSPAQFSQNPNFLYPPPELSPAFHQKPIFPYPPPRPSMFYCHRTYAPLKPNKAKLNGNVKPRKPIGSSGNSRNLQPRLFKPKAVRVTKNRSLSSPEEDKVEIFLAGKTSVMIRNIPNDFRRNDLVNILDSHCRNENKDSVLAQNRSSYDFLYLPMDFVTRCNLGYAFVNFTTSVAAERFRRDFDKFVWIYPGSKKVCEITLAKLQGEDLIRHFKDSRFPCNSDIFLPVVLSPPSDGFTSYSLNILGSRIGSRRVFGR